MIYIRSCSRLALLIMTYSWLNFSNAFSQRLEGIYTGTFEKRPSVIELKKSNDLVVGVVHMGQNERWFFYGLIQGTTFSNHAMFELGDSPYVKGEIKMDTLSIAVDARDSSYVGKFFRTTNKRTGIDKVVDQIFGNQIAPRDKRLIGEWICIASNAPEKAQNITARLILLENGNLVPDYAYIQKKTIGQNSKRSYSIDEIKRTIGNITWNTISDKQLTTIHESSFLPTEEVVSTYELRNDTLMLTSIQNNTSVYVRVKKKNSD